MPDLTNAIVANILNAFLGESIATPRTFTSAQLANMKAVVLANLATNSVITNEDLFTSCASMEPQTVFADEAGTAKLVQWAVDEIETVLLSDDFKAALVVEGWTAPS